MKLWVARNRKVRGRTDTNTEYLLSDVDEQPWWNPEASAWWGPGKDIEPRDWNRHQSLRLTPGEGPVQVKLERVT